MRRWAAGLSLVCFIAALLWYFGAVEMIASRYEANQVRRQDHSAFQQWIRADANRAREFDTLSAYLDKQGVAKIIPVWTLTRGDAGRFPWCKGDDFVMPPRNDWPRIVPALRLVRDRVIPVVGRIEVRSAYREQALNACVHGAPKSRHLSFAAIDLIAPDQPDSKTAFTKLCAAWAEAGPTSRWGLGAYFDPDKPTRNPDARFHVDAAGWRSWGYSKKAKSSGCRLLAAKQAR